MPALGLQQTPKPEIAVGENQELLLLVSAGIFRDVCTHPLINACVIIHAIFS
jgi:hypothetical protein